jgi:hypothetical protein
VKAIIKGYHSPDVDFENFTPKTDNWSFLLQLIVGPSNGEGEESFDIIVCSPQHVAEMVAHDGIVNGRHTLIASDVSKVKPFIEKYVTSNAIGDTWQDVANKLCQLGHWEFEDYRESS